MAKRKVKGSAYINDELLKVAFVGTRHQPLTEAAVPDALQAAVEQIKAQAADPEDAFFTAINLCMTYERASHTGLVDVGTLEGPCVLKPPSPVAERYISPRLTAWLTAPEVNQVEWLAILARLQGSGLKIPVGATCAFVRNFERWRPYLPPLYKDFPVEFLSSAARFVLQFASRDGLVLEPHSWAELGATERRAQVAQLLAQSAYDEALSLLETGFAALPVAERLACLQLWQANWLNFLSEGYQAGWFGVNQVAPPHKLEFNTAAIGQAVAEALSQVYQAQVVATAVTTNERTLSDAAARVEVSLQGKSDLIKVAAQIGISRQAATVGSALSVGARLERWLQQVLATDRVLEVKQKAALLLRMLPGSRMETQMVEFVRKVFSIKSGRHHLVFKAELYRSHQEVAAALVKFFPELSAERDYTSSSRKNKFTATDKRYIAGLTVFLPPPMWFELFNRKRTGNDKIDADVIFSDFMDHFIGWNFGNYCDFDRDRLIQNFFLRTKYELGPEFCAAFLRHGWKPRNLFASFNHYPQRLSYAERESCPLALGVNDFFYLNLVRLTGFVPSFCKQPLACWGPKFSRHLLEPILELYEVQREPPYSLYLKSYCAPALLALGLSLDPEYRSQVKARLVQLLADWEQALAQGSYPHWPSLVRYDNQCAYPQSQRQNLQLFLRFFERADHLTALCAKELAAVSGK